MNDKTTTPAGGDSKPTEDPKASEKPPEEKKEEGSGKAPKTKQARALLDCDVDGVQYKANALVEASAKAIDQAEKDGKVDTHKDAIAVADRPKPAAKDE